MYLLLDQTVPLLKFYAKEVSSRSSIHEILACRISWIEEPGELPSLGSQSQTRPKCLSIDGVGLSVMD